jgi:uncharacterized membrane protein YfhO
LRGSKKSFSGPKNKVEFISERNNRLNLVVRTTENTLLVLNDTYFSGWKAYVQPVRNRFANGVKGEEKKILRASYNFRAIPLEAGEYEIQFIYDPISFKIGMLVSLLTSAGIVAYSVKRGRSKSNQKTRASN